jgi:hypothetical protein
MEFEYQGESIVEERLVWHEAEEARLRELAASYLRQAEEHATKAAAFRLVVEDIDLALQKFWGRGKQASTVQEEERSEPSPSTDPSVSESPVQEVTGNPRPDGKAFIDWVREAVRPQADTFDLMSVRQTLDALAPGLLEGTTDRNALSKALSRMAETREISVLRKGQGKRPALYGKQNSTVSLARFVDLDSEADDDRPKEEVNVNNGQASDRVPTSG